MVIDQDMAADELLGAFVRKHEGVGDVDLSGTPNALNGQFAKIINPMPCLSTLQIRDLNNAESDLGYTLRCPGWNNSPLPGPAAWI